MGEKNNGNIYLTARAALSSSRRSFVISRSAKRKEIAAKIAEARGHGDLSENAEYDAAKEAQEHLEIRIGKLEETLMRARIIESSELPNDKVYILSYVKLEDLKTGEKTEYRLVSPEEANFERTRSPSRPPSARV